MAEGADKRFLIEYAADIEVPKAADDRDLLERVPSLVAWPIQYARALGDRTHPLHSVVAREWRALLAVFALGEWLEGVAVEVREVEVPEREAPDEPRFITILRNQLPRPDAEWRHWRLFYVNRQLIGATSPWSIVFTPADYQCPEALPFQKDRKLIDPVDYFKEKRGGAHELDHLAHWVQLVLETFPWEMNGPGKHEDAIKVALEEWQKDIASALKDLRFRGVRPDLGVRAWRLHEARARVHEAPYRCFLAPVVGDGDAPQSDLLLKVRADLDEVLAIPERGVDGSVRVHRTIFGDSIDIAELASPEGGPNWKVKDGRIVPYRYVIPERVFFPKKLAAFAGTDEEIELDALATPLTPRFFELFDYETLGPLETFLATRMEAQNLVVQLKVPMVRGVWETIERRYDVTRDLVRIPNPAAFAVWPNFVAEDWNDNFASYAHDGDDLVVVPLARSGRELDRAAVGDALVRVWETDIPPIGFGLFEPGDRATGRTGGSLGLVLRKSFRVAARVEELSRSLLNLAERDGTASYPQFTAMQGIPT
jgi:hypothetical protein